MSIVAPLKLPPFRRLYAAQVVANFGDGLDYLAIVTIVVFEWQRGASALGVMALATALPLVFGAPVFGVVADRFEPRIVMVLANVVRAGAVALIMFVDDFPWVCLLAAVAGVCAGFFGAAEQRFIRYRVPENQLLQANSLRSTTERMLTGLTGPGIAAVLIALVGARGTLAVTAGCFALSALAVFFVGRIARPDDPAEPEERAGWLRRVAAGVHHVGTLPSLRLVVAGVAVAYLFSTMFDVMLPVWYRDMGGGPAFTGTAMTCMGVGGALGALALAKFGDRFNLTTVMALSSIVIGLLVGAMGLAGTLEGRVLLGVWLVFAACIGVCAAVAMIGYGTLVQRLTPPELMGRVGALTGAAVTAPTVVGPAVSPVIASAVGVDGLFTICGAGLIAVGLVIVWRSRAHSAPAAAPSPQAAPTAIK
ncbi:MFS transporter [Microbispora sp. KK1-11]|uniref:MFS transporter n=1 Tax=Microbispora sp. KK1-11 TaxID=2053005 RepID=UPI00115A2C01|nr:MFS transporter [Microbispora sp. KK1-11]TQS25871.1 MFS transporter [Microbispora sp. KK1-11]